MEGMLKTCATKSYLVSINKTNAIIIEPEIKSGLQSMVYYHGWGSSIERALFRGHILAMQGYPVLIPELKYHEKHHRIDYSSRNMAKFFWQIVYEMVAKHSIISNWLENNYSIKDEQVVVGHSMGGFIAGGVMTQYPVKYGLLYNTSCSWQETNHHFVKLFKDEAFLSHEGKINLFDPINKLDTLEGKFFFLANGEKDNIVPIAGNQNFVDKCDNKASDNTTVLHRIYPEVGHAITDHMLEDGLNFLDCLEDR